MAKDYLTLSCNPAEEEWPGGPDSTTDQQSAVLRRYLQMLVDKFPIPPDLEGKVRFARKTFPHDFGSYTEVVVWFDTEDRRARSFAYMCDAEMPGRWTDTEVVRLDEYLAEQQKKEATNGEDQA